MRTFFESVDSNLTPWNEGSLVVIDPEWRTNEREGFDTALTSPAGLGSGIQMRNLDAQEKRIFRTVLRRGTHRGPAYPPEPIVSPTWLDLGPKVYAGEIDRARRGSWQPGFYEAIGPGAPQGKVRALVDVCLPAYTQDGRYALLRAGSTWSSHPASLNYLLERKQKGWVVILRTTMLYL